MLLNRMAVAGSVMAVCLWCSSCDWGVDPPESDFLIGERLQATDWVDHWMWVPTGSEIAFSLLPVYNSPLYSYEAVDVETGSVRTILPPQDDGPISNLKFASPYVYYTISNTVHRNRVGGSRRETLVSSEFGSSFSVTPDHHWLISLAARGDVILLDLESGVQREITAKLPYGSLLFLAPDASSMVALVYAGESRDPLTTARWIDLRTMSSQEIPLPCGWQDDSLLAWERDATPSLYMFCDDTFHHIVTGGSTSVVLSIIGEDGSWSPTLDRVSFWRRSCPGGWTELQCRKAERELWVQRLNRNEPSKMGTIVLDAQGTLRDTGPALFSFDGRYVGFSLIAGSHHDGVYITSADGGLD